MRRRIASLEDTGELRSNAWPRRLANRVAKAENPGVQQGFLHVGVISAVVITVSCAAVQPASAQTRETVAYHCAAGATVTVTYGPDWAEVTLGTRSSRLNQVPAASGVRYTDGRWTWHVKGSEGILSGIAGEIFARDCRAQSVESPGQLIEQAMELVRHIDARLPALRVLRRTQAMPRRGAEPRRLILWLERGKPVKVLATEPTESGQMIGQSEYYFADGRLRFVRHPFARYVLRDGRLLLWLDEHMKALTGLPARDFQARERSLLSESRRYLRLFGLR